MSFRIRRLSSIFVVFFSCLSITQSADASFEKAMEVYSSGRFVEAKSAFEAMAAIGDEASIFNLGVMYYRGEAVDADPVKAYALMTVANEGLAKESFSKISKVVYSKLNDAQVEEVKGLYDEIKSIYGKKNIENNIFPKLLDDKDCVAQVQPIKRGSADYPYEERSQGRMGLVYAEYTISPEGYPRDINITSSTGRAFTKATIEAVKSNLYTPTPTGLPIVGHRVVFIYTLGIKDGDKYNTKAIVKELGELKQKSESGDVVAQYFYGLRINGYRHFQKYINDVDLQYREANEWYTKSANAGLANAQYEIGRNMLEGRGCEVDKEGGFKWVKAAAVGGYSPAQAYLANSNFSDHSSSKQKAHAVMTWLRNAAQSSNYAVQVMLSWELATSDDKSLRDADESLSLLKGKPLKYEDDLRVLETKAAAFAQKGNYKKAVKFQKKAAKLAKSKDWVIPKLQQRLVAYESNQDYSGSYY